MRVSCRPPTKCEDRSSTDKGKNVLAHAGTDGFEDFENSETVIRTARICRVLVGFCQVIVRVILGYPTTIRYFKSMS